MKVNFAEHLHLITVYGFDETILVMNHDHDGCIMADICYLDLMNDRFGILKSQICMVGDRLDTDILFGQNGGCKTLLVLSGK